MKKIQISLKSDNNIDHVMLGPKYVDTVPYRRGKSSIRVRIFRSFCVS